MKKEKEKEKDDTVNDIHKGYYRHYKGDIYKVIEVANDTKYYNEKAVVYKDEDGETWYTPLRFFNQDVYVKNTYQKTFEPLMVAVVQFKDGTYECELDITRNVIINNTTSDVRRAKMYNPLNKYEMLKLKMEIDKHKFVKKEIVIVPMTVMYDGFYFNEFEMNKKLEEEMKEVEKLCLMYSNAMSEK